MTLVELLLVMGIMLIVAGISFSLFSGAMRFNDSLTEKTDRAVAQLQQSKKYGVRSPRVMTRPTGTTTNQPSMPQQPLFTRPMSNPPVPPVSASMAPRNSSSQLVNFVPGGSVSTRTTPVAPQYAAGQVYVSRMPYKKLLSRALPGKRAAEAASPVASAGPMSAPATSATVGDDLLWRDYDATQAFTLHSRPGATKVLYMDFDGHTVTGTSWNKDFNNKNDFTIPAWSMDADRKTFTNTEKDAIIRMWRRVAEDFIPFDIDVTTQDPGVSALMNNGDGKWGIRAIIGPNPSGYSAGSPTAWGSFGGIAYVGSFSWTTDTPCFVVNGDLSSNPDASLPTTVSHEVGHSLGLGHDGDSTKKAPNDEYYLGHGTGNVSWGPIMGGAFNRNLDQWSRDTYKGGNNSEDDLAIITSGNGFGYYADDYGDTLTSAQALNGFDQGTLNTTYGVIGQNTDVDWFYFYADPGAISIKIDPLYIGPNLDILAELYDSTGTLIIADNPLNEVYADLNSVATTSDKYYVKISGTGRFDPMVDGYTNYGSLGSYEITGTVVPKPATIYYRRQGGRGRPPYRNILSR